MCTAYRRRLLLQPAYVDLVLSQLLRVSRQERFAVAAYCVMPDHLHLLAEGLEDGADLRRFCRHVRQATAHRWRRTGGERLWQHGYYERTLREEEDSRTVVRYMLENPVRAGLVERVEQYPYVGSLEWSREALMEWVYWDGT